MYKKKWGILQIYSTQQSWERHCIEFNFETMLSNYAPAPFLLMYFSFHTSNVYVSKSIVSNKKLCRYLMYWYVMYAITKGKYLLQINYMCEIRKYSSQFVYRYLQCNQKKRIIHVNLYHLTFKLNELLNRCIKRCTYPTVAMYSKLKLCPTWCCI